MALLLAGCAGPNPLGHHPNFNLVTACTADGASLKITPVFVADGPVVVEAFDAKTTIPLGTVTVVGGKLDAPLAVSAETVARIQKELMPRELNWYMVRLKYGSALDGYQADATFCN